MHHYNFPGYSVGEAKPAAAPAPRDSATALSPSRALLPVIPPVDGRSP